MVFRRRKREQEETSVEIVAVGQGVLVQGTSTSVTAFADQVLTLTNESAGRVSQLVADGMAAAGALGGPATASREYFEFSPRAQELLRQHQLIPTDDGWFRSFVKSGDRFAGNLDWKPVEVDPTQALAVQTAAVHLAMRAAINDLTAAIERVEGKVDKLVNLARAERIGAAAGDRRTLQPLVERCREGGRLTRTAWSTVDTLGSQIARDIEALRAYVLAEVSELKPVAFVRPRSSELRELTDELLKESLALLVVVEQNHMLWQELFVAHVATHEPESLNAAVSDTRSQLAAMTLADQELLGTLQTAARELLEPSGYEGFLLLERHRLTKRGEELTALVDWFADQRHLDSDELVIEFPSLKESVMEARSALRAGAGAAGDSLGSQVGKLTARLSGRNGDEVAEA